MIRDCFNNKYIDRQDINRPFHLIIKEQNKWLNRGLWAELEEGDKNPSAPLTCCLKLAIVGDGKRMDYKLTNIEEVILLNKRLSHIIKLWKKQLNL